MEDVIGFLNTCLREKVKMIQYCLDSGNEEMLSWAYLPEAVKLVAMIDKVKKVEGLNDIAV